MRDTREEIRRLMIAVNRIDEAYYEILRTLGIKDRAFVLLYATADGKTYSQKKICAEWGIPRTTLNTIVQEYIAAGYIALAATGHKEKDIILTKKGKEYAERILTPVFDAEEKAIKPLLPTGIVELTEQLANSLKKEFSSIKKHK